MVMLKAFFMWFILLLLILAGITFFVSNSWIENVTAMEKESAVEQFGEKRAESAFSKAHATFVAVFLDTGIEKQTFDLFIPKQNHENTHMDGMGANYFKMMYTRLSAFWAAIYQGVIRFYLVLAWVPFLVPFLIAVLVDAFITRTIKNENFEFNSPIYFSVASHGFLFGIFFILYYFLAPFTVTYAMVPIWSIVMLGMLHLLICNSQRTK